VGWGKQQLKKFPIYFYMPVKSVGPTVNIYVYGYS